MSKAFLRESDFPNPTELPPAVVTLPAGAKNYITAAGAQRLRDELGQLMEGERPRLVAQHDPGAKRELQVLDRRIRQLQQSLGSAEVVPPPAAPYGVVHFGATVTVKEKEGSIVRYRIVGVDEADGERGWVSWQSPLARALLNAHLGQCVTFPTPAGPSTLEVAAVDYEAAAGPG
jgi:transcription elongation factor GreB